MLGNIFMKRFKFLRDLYIFWTILVIFRLKKFIQWNLGESIQKKWNLRYIYFLKCSNLSHGLNFSPKISLLPNQGSFRTNNRFETLSQATNQETQGEAIGWPLTKYDLAQQKVMEIQLQSVEDPSKESMYVQSYKHNVIIPYEEGPIEYDEVEDIDIEEIHI